MSFKSDIGRFKKEVRSDQAKRVAAVAIGIWEGVTSKSPVDTGRFRASWNLSEGFSDTSVAAEAQSVALNIPSVGNPPDFPVYYITNALPYAQRLENGWSNQAPLGMVALTVAEFEAFR